MIVGVSVGVTVGLAVAVGCNELSGVPRRGAWPIGQAAKKAINSSCQRKTLKEMNPLGLEVTDHMRSRVDSFGREKDFGVRLRILHIFDKLLFLMVSFLVF